MPSSLDEGSEPTPRATWPGRIGPALTTVARLLLAIGMMPYAISKLIDLQFQVSAWTYAQPLGMATGKNLTWAFFGYSPHFQVLLGICEFVPCVLLFSARTRRIGALLILPVVLNVFLVNIFLDLWPATQIISGVLLGLDLFLLLWDSPLYLDLLRRLIVKPRPIAHPGLQLAVTILAIVLPVAAVTAQVYDLHQAVQAEQVPISDFIGNRQINRAGSWKLLAATLDGASIPVSPGDAFYFDFGKKAVFTDGVRPSIGKFQASHDDRTVTITGVNFAGSDAPIAGTYRTEANKIYLQGTRDKREITLTLERLGW